MTQDWVQEQLAKAIDICSQQCCEGNIHSQSLHERRLSGADADQMYGAEPLCAWA